MTPHQALALWEFVMGACPQQAANDGTPVAWAELLDDVDYADAADAAKTICKAQPFCSPAEIRAEVKRIRARRVNAFGVLPDPPAEIEADPVRYRLWFAQTKEDIAAGRLTRERQAITTGRSRQTDRELPPDLREQMRRVIHTPPSAKVPDPIEPPAEPRGEVVQGEVVSSSAG